MLFVTQQQTSLNIFFYPSKANKRSIFYFCSFIVLFVAIEVVEEQIIVSIINIYISLNNIKIIQNCFARDICIFMLWKMFYILITANNLCEIG